MSNETIIKEFLKGATKGHTPSREVTQGVYTNRMSTLSINEDKLINYETTIARRVGDKIALNINYYSRTTSKIQNLIKKLCNELGVEVKNEI